jgi:hypothetical protein
MSNMDQNLEQAAERDRIIRSKNRVLALVLVGFVVLFFAISIVKFG